MSDIKLVFSDDFPEQLKKAAEEAISPHLKLLKMEIRELHVAISDDNTVFTMDSHRRYHRADLALSTEFFSYEEEEAAKYVRHEFFHVLLDPLTREMQHIIFNYVMEEVAKKHLAETIEELEERVVDGLAHVFGDCGGGCGGDFGGGDGDGFGAEWAS